MNSGAYNLNPRAIYRPEAMSERIDKLMRENSVTQKDLADRLGFTQSYVSRIICGDRSITIKTLHDICLLFDVSPDYLMYGIQEPSVQRQI